MSEKAEYKYDIFISYSHADRGWVEGELLLGLERAGLKVIIDYRDFEIGVPSLVNMERAVNDSRHTLIVLTPEWIESEWTAFESLLVSTADPAGRRRKLLPLMLKKCQLPIRIGMLTYADFTNPTSRGEEMARLLRGLGISHPEPLLPKRMPPQGGALEQRYLTRLREILIRYFDEGELRNLCVDLNVDYDNLPGDGKANKAREFVAYLERRGRLAELVARGSQLRPHVSWEEL